MENNTKQILFSILGLTLVLLAVLGTTYSFFTYVQTGATNNTVATTELGLNLIENANNNAIYLTNQFPMTNAEVTTGSGIISGRNDNVTSMTFSIAGYSSGKSEINYSVYVVDGDLDNEKIRFNDSEVNIFIDSYSSVINNAASGQTQTIVIDSPTSVSEIARDETGDRLIATGTIKEGTTSLLPQTDTYTLKMFINDTVRISDTKQTVKMEGATNEVSGTKYCASDRVVNNGNYVKGCKLYDDNEDGIVDNAVAASTDGVNAHNYLTTYEDLYYSIKIKVRANSNVSEKTN